ncbi:MAG: hypothetical protein LBP87_04240 [Planctomycetaceae bacterium]|jgi:hypothetical protein|nr:hypothetical protein [Planctomycetaceae bacterium]
MIKIIDIPNNRNLCYSQYGPGIYANTIKWHLLLIDVDYNICIVCWDSFIQELGGFKKQVDGFYNAQINRYSNYITITLSNRVTAVLDIFPDAYELCPKNEPPFHECATIQNCLDKIKELTGCAVARNTFINAYKNCGFYFINELLKNENNNVHLSETSQFPESP